MTGAPKEPEDRRLRGQMVALGFGDEARRLRARNMAICAAAALAGAALTAVMIADRAATEPTLRIVVPILTAMIHTPVSYEAHQYPMWVIVLGAWPTILVGGFFLYLLIWFPAANRRADQRLAARLRLEGSLASPTPIVRDLTTGAEQTGPMED